MTRPPDISVVIPAYNAVRTIDAALQSIYAQTLAPAEIIVVDDGSKDDTAAFVAEWHPRARLIRQVNQGCGQARNTGAREARGEWLAFLDADDLWLPTKLERQIPYTTDPKVAAVTCRATRWSGRPNPGAGEPMPERIGFDDLWVWNDLKVSSSLVRRTAFEQAGGFWKERACEDYHLWLRLTASGWAIANVPEDLIVYSPTETSLSRQTESFAAAEAACLRDVATCVGMPAAQMNARLAQCYQRHARGAIHTRNLPAARRLALASLRHRISAAPLLTLALACTPRPMLDLSRRVLVLGGNRSPSGA